MLALRPDLWTSIWYKCPICERYFSSPDRVIDHKDNSNCRIRDYEIHIDNQYELLMPIKSSENQLSNIQNHDPNSTTKIKEESVKPDIRMVAGGPSQSSLDEKVNSWLLSSKESQKCYFCKRFFPNESGLEDHILIHTKEQPYSCNSCGQRFIQKEILLNHTPYCDHARAKDIPNHQKRLRIKYKESKKRDSKRRRLCQLRTYLES